MCFVWAYERFASNASSFEFVVCVKDELIKRNEREKNELNQVDLFSTYLVKGAFQGIKNDFASANDKCSKKSKKRIIIALWI